MSKPQYESYTRSRYRQGDTARAYDRRMRGISVDRVFAWLERRAVSSYLDAFAHDRATEQMVVVDAPVGTGKLAPVWRSRRVKLVVGIDVSATMMSLIPPEDRPGVRLVVGDAAALPIRSRAADFSACVRLLHRVPEDVARDVLRSLCDVTKRAVIITYTGTPRAQAVYPWLRKLLRRPDEWRLVLEPSTLAAWLPEGWSMRDDRTLTKGFSRARIALAVRDA